MRTEKKELNVQIGKRLQTVRENSGYTQEAFAEALDIGVEHYRKIELGMYGLQRENMLILYKKYKIDLLKKRLRISDEEYADIKSIIKYHDFQIDKKDGVEKRDITAPDKRIKEVQTRIMQLLQKVERPDWLISGEKGKCYIDNGKRHIQSNYFLTMDIKKFYDNCKREYVYRFF